MATITPRPIYELHDRLQTLRAKSKLFEAQRLEQRTMFDIEMLEQMGRCSGIENYSRHLSKRAPGDPPPTLLDYFPDDFLVFVDESHQTRCGRCSRIGNIMPTMASALFGKRAQIQICVRYSLLVLESNLVLSAYRIFALSFPRRRGINTQSTLNSIFLSSIRIFSGCKDAKGERKRGLKLRNCEGEEEATIQYNLLR